MVFPSIVLAPSMECVLLAMPVSALNKRMLFTEVVKTFLNTLLLCFKE